METLWSRETKPAWTSLTTPKARRYGWLAPA